MPFVPLSRPRAHELAESQNSTDTPVMRARSPWPPISTPWMLLSVSSGCGEVGVQPVVGAGGEVMVVQHTAFKPRQPHGTGIEVCRSRGKRRVGRTAHLAELAARGEGVGFGEQMEHFPCDIAFQAAKGSQVGDRRRCAGKSLAATISAVDICSALWPSRRWTSSRKTLLRSPSVAVAERFFRAIKGPLPKQPATRPSRRSSSSARQTREASIESLQRTPRASRTPHPGRSWFEVTA